jgi:hypothetical protein
MSDFPLGDIQKMLEVVPLARASHPVSAQIPFQWELPCQGRGCEEAPAHRDEYDVGRMQCVIALRDGAFDVWPNSHKMFTKKPPCEKGHYHTKATTKLTLAALYQRCVFSCSPGDVLVFLGGHFYHGSPAIGATDPSPRLVTYATFWPPGTQKGQLHSEGKCGKLHCVGELSADHPASKKQKAHFGLCQ